MRMGMIMMMGVKNCASFFFLPSFLPAAERERERERGEEERKGGSLALDGWLGWLERGNSSAAAKKKASKKMHLQAKL